MHPTFIHTFFRIVLLLLSLTLYHVDVDKIAWLVASCVWLGRIQREIRTRLRETLESFSIASALRPYEYLLAALILLQKKKNRFEPPPSSFYHKRNASSTSPSESLPPMPTSLKRRRSASPCINEKDAPEDFKGFLKAIVEEDTERKKKRKRLSEREEKMENAGGLKLGVVKKRRLRNPLGLRVKIEQSPTSLLYILATRDEKEPVLDVDLKVCKPASRTRVVDAAKLHSRLPLAEDYPKRTENQPPVNHFAHIPTAQVDYPGHSPAQVAAYPSPQVGRKFSLASDSDECIPFGAPFHVSPDSLKPIGGPIFNS